MVDSNVVLKRSGRIRKCVAALETIRRTYSKDQFLKNELVQAASERNTQIAVQAVLDICSHIVADHRLEVPDEERHSIQILAANKIIPQRLAKTLSSMAGVRNILVHEYLEVDHERLYAITDQNLVDFERFIRVISKLL